MLAEKEAPAWVLFGIILVITLFIARKEDRSAASDVAAGSAALGALLAIAYTCVSLGRLPPLFIFGLADTFFLYLPCAFALVLLRRLVLRKPLQAFRSAEEAQRREQKGQNGA